MVFLQNPWQNHDKQRSDMNWNLPAMQFVADFGKQWNAVAMPVLAV